MRPNQIARLGVVVLVIAAVAVVVRFKEAGSASPTGDPTSSMGSMVLTDQSRTTADVPPPAQHDDTHALPRLLDLGADKCIPCKKMAPILEALRGDFADRFEVVFIDVWKDSQAAGPYGIRLIPTQIFFDEEGGELFRHEGFFSREDILTTWSDLGYVFEASTEEVSG